MAVRGLGSITLPMMAHKGWEIFCQYVAILWQRQNIWANEDFDWTHLPHAGFILGHILQSFTLNKSNQWSALNCNSLSLTQTEEECTHFRQSVMTDPRSVIQAVVRWFKEMALLKHEFIVKNQNHSFCLRMLLFKWICHLQRDVFFYNRNCHC